MAGLQPGNEDIGEGRDLAAKVLRMTTKSNMREKAVKEVTELINTLVPNSSVPKSTKALRNALDIKDRFVSLPMCLGCKKLYDVRLPDICKNTRYDGPICNTVKPPTETLLAYQPVSYGLTNLVARIENFSELCNVWRNRESGHMIADIYDGNKWASMVPWLDEEGYKSLLLQFNIDWFCPYTCMPYSFGAIYMTVLNLPRALRYKEENVLLVGCIPGPCEPKKGELNEIMHILVNDLTECQTEFFISGERYRVRLFNCVSDLPATRASMGLSGHSADQGCSKCDSALLHGGKGKIGLRRRHMDHISTAADIQACDTATGKAAISSRTVFKDAAILQLTHFKPVDDHVVDAMHALCSGIGRTLKNICEPVYEKLKTNLETAGATKALSSKVHTALTSSQIKDLYECYAHCFIGTIRRKQRLELIFIMKEIMMIMMARSLTEDDLERGEDLVRQFLDKFAAEFGADSLVPNMHMLLHITDDIRRFGPSPANWCFPYERYNRTLKNIPTNNKNTAPQVMRNCVTKAQVARSETIHPNSRMTPMDHQEHLIEAPLMSLNQADFVKRNRRKKAVSIEVREAIHSHLIEAGVGAVNQIDVLEVIGVYEEEIKEGTSVKISGSGDIMLVNQLLLVNNIHIVVVGHILYSEKRNLYCGLIKQWQFLSSMPRAISPYSIATTVTVSRKLVTGVTLYTSEIRPSKYTY